MFVFEGDVTQGIYRLSRQVDLPEFLYPATRLSLLLHIRGNKPCSPYESKIKICMQMHFQRVNTIFNFPCTK
jgi:hypothetical protein